MNEIMAYLNNGLAVVIVIALGYAGWKVLIWTGENVIIPSKDALLKHLDTVDNTLKSVGDSLTSVNQSLKDVHARVQDLVECHEPFFAESIKDRKQINQRLDKIEKDLDK